MNLAIFLALAACLSIVWAASGAPTPRDAPKAVGDPLGFPPLESTEWKKQASGLEIWDVKEGDGTAIREGDTVTVHYCGWLENQTEFDSSFKRGQPATFPLGRVIKGWQEGLPGMKPGGIRRLRIPASLGYGAAGAGGLIPPNATLIFVVEVPAKK